MSPTEFRTYIEEHRLKPPSEHEGKQDLPRRYRGWSNGLKDLPITYTPEEIAQAITKGKVERNDKLHILQLLSKPEIFGAVHIDVWNKKEDTEREKRFMATDVFDHFLTKYQMERSKQKKQSETKEEKRMEDEDEEDEEYDNSRSHDHSVINTNDHLVYTIRTANGLCQIGLGRLEIGGL